MTADFSAERIDLAREEDFRLGGLLVHPSTRQLESGGKSETLQPRIMQVLVALARRRGQVVSRDELVETCWEGRAVGEDALNRCTQQIRKLGETSGAFRLETIPRVGYRLHAEKDAAPASQRSVATSSAPFSRRWLIPALAIGALVTAGVATLAWQGVVNSRKVEVAVTTTLAVLPFDALDDDPAIQRMAQVVPRDMADQFSRAGISMTAPARSMTYSGDAKARAGAELGADLLLDGTVKREGDKAHISARLYHAERGVTLWSTEMTADPDDPVVDERLSALVGRAISWTAPLRILNSDRPNAVEEARTFLRILQLSQDGDVLGSQRAAEQFAREAPDQVHARSSAAIQAMTSLRTGTQRDGQEAALLFARKEAAEALKLDPREGGAYLASSAVLDASMWAERIAMLRKGIEMDPQFTRLQNILAERLLESGALGEALALAKRARTEEPLSAQRENLLVRASLANGDFAAMKTILDEYDRVWPEDRAMTARRLRVAIWLGSLAEADEVLATLAPQGSAAAASRQIAVIKALIAAKRSGEATGAEEVARLCSGVAPEERTHAFGLTCMFAGGVLDRPAISFVAAEFLLERIHNSPSGEDAWRFLREPDPDAHASELFLPWMASMRADEKVIDVFERLGLLDYWRETGKWPDFCENGKEPSAASVCARIKTIN